MNTQHTPAFLPPWHWTFSPTSNERIALVSADNKDVLLATDDGDQNVYFAVSPEHARLIASAPDLLTALREAVAAFDYTIAAMAKGQTISVSSLQNCAANARAVIAKAESQP